MLCKAQRRAFEDYKRQQQKLLEQIQRARTELIEAMPPLLSAKRRRGDEGQKFQVPAGGAAGGAPAQETRSAALSPKGTGAEGTAQPVPATDDQSLQQEKDESDAEDARAKHHKENRFAEVVAFAEAANNIQAKNRLRQSAGVDGLPPVGEPAPASSAEPPLGK